MRYSTSILAVLAASPLLVAALPVKSRAASAQDGAVFNFALVLENLEAQFYQQGLAKFTDSDFTDAGFSNSLIPSQGLGAIATDEQTHAQVIQQTLTDNGVTPLNCSYDFDSVLTDVPTMAAVARLVEFVGVSAYLGAATLLQDPILLDAAASIMTNEARHQTLLNILSGQGSAIPQAFDIPLTPQEVSSIAGPFITGTCNTGITATNALTITNSGSIAVGTQLTFSGNNVQSSGQFCQMITGGLPISITLPIESCSVPSGINGPVAVWITSDDQPLINNVIDRATTQQIAGPAIFFVDSQPEILGGLVRGSGTNSSASSTTTTTISPEQAASIIAGASSTAAAGSTGDAAAAVPASTPLPTNFTGTSPDGRVDVLGISSVTRPSASATSTSSSSSATSTTSS